MPNSLRSYAMREPVRESYRLREFASLIRSGGKRCRPSGPTVRPKGARGAPCRGPAGPRGRVPVWPSSAARAGPRAAMRGGGARTLRGVRACSGGRFVPRCRACGAAPLRFLRTAPRLPCVARGGARAACGPGLGAARPLRRGRAAPPLAGPPCRSAFRRAPCSVALLRSARPAGSPALRPRVLPLSGGPRGRAGPPLARLFPGSAPPGGGARGLRAALMGRVAPPPGLRWVSVGPVPLRLPLCLPVGCPAWRPAVGGPRRPCGRRDGIQKVLRLGSTNGSRKVRAGKACRPSWGWFRALPAPLLSTIQSVLLDLYY